MQGAAYAGVDERAERSVSTLGRKGVLAALMASMALVGLDGTAVSTAVPSIVHDLGGFSQFPWLFSIYLLTQAVTVPLHGRFADMLGRKPVLLLGLGVFIAGSLLSGISFDMTSLIVFRGLQGIGGGAIVSTATTIVGDMYTVSERARIQGAISSVWALSSVLGPTIGGLLCEYLSWRWIFYVNLPLGIAAVSMLMRLFHEEMTRRPHRVDLLGAFTLVSGSSLVILALLAGSGWGWTSLPSILVLAGGCGALSLFALAERHASEPILPPWVFKGRLLIAANAIALVAGASAFGVVSYVPTYVEGVAGAGPVLAGVVVGAIMVGWPLASGSSGWLYMRIGYRDTAIVGGLITICGAVLFVLLVPSSPVWRVAVASFLVGVGLGFGSNVAIVSAQSAVQWSERGVVTGAITFSRSTGSALGVAAFGAIANSSLSGYLTVLPARLAKGLPRSVDDATRLLLQGEAPHGTAGALLRHGLYGAMHEVYWALLAVAVVGALLASVMPGWDGRPMLRLRRVYGPEI